MSSGFSSVWAADIDNFLAFKRRLGYPNQRAEFTLRALDRHLSQTMHTRSGRRLGQVLLSWVQQRPGRKPVSVACELAVVRQFFTYLRGHGHPDLLQPLWPRLPATSNYRPHVFSTNDVKKLVRLTQILRGTYRRAAYRMLILVLYCTGVRFGEAVRLRMRDVNLAENTLFISPSKGRSRWVPFDDSLANEIKSYLPIRLEYSPAAPEDGFFVGAEGILLHTKTASETIRGLLRAAGLKPISKGRIGPRPYDFRHTFAVHRLTQWYREGVDLQRQLALLSAYMGHDDLLGTEAYLNATPELLEIAATRFRTRFVATEAPSA